MSLLSTIKYNINSERFLKSSGVKSIRLVPGGRGNKVTGDGYLATKN